MVEGQLREQVLIYTDGSCDPNPGSGGWGAVLVWEFKAREISGAELETTNNRMELTAAVLALRALKRPCEVTICTDSQYLRNGITKWVDAWTARGWRRANGRPVENVDLWQSLLRETERHGMTWRWVRGHHGNPLNERADALAREARAKLLASDLSKPSALRDAKRKHQDAPAMPRVTIYARGCAFGAPGPAGYAALLVRGQGPTRLVAGGAPSATSNAMELSATIAGLEALAQPTQVTLFTASKYVLEGATRWLALWESNGWRTKDGQPVKHRDLWMRLARATGDHDIAWKSPPLLRREPHDREAAEAARAEASRVKKSQGSNV